MKYALSVLILLMLFSCKKDKLKGDDEILVGNWKWIYSDHEFGWCQANHYYELITPQSSGTEYEMEFKKKGRVTFSENNEEIESYRIVITTTKTDNCIFSDTGHVQYYMRFDNDPDKPFDFCIKEDTLAVWRGFPFEDYEYGCEVYYSYFVRQ